MTADPPFLTGGNPYETRVVRSIAFIDLSGFTSYTDSEGDGAAVVVLSQFRTAAREVCARHGVRIAKWLGDGAMLIGVEREDIAEALVDIEGVLKRIGAPLALRCGVATGPVILFEGDDYIGNAVNLAARLCDQAAPAQVLAPHDFVSSLMVNTRATPVGSIDIAGMADPVTVVELTAR